MSTHEVAAALANIKAKLEANATLVSLSTGGFHRGAAPNGTTPPWVSFQYQAGTDTLTFNGYRVFSRLLFLVKAVGPDTSTATIFQMAALIDDVLKRRSPEAVTGAYIDSCHREEPIQYDETLPDGTKYMHCGGLYRPIVEQA